MKTLHKLLATGTMLTATAALITAALLSIGADNLPQQRQSPQPPATLPATQPGTQPSAVPLYVGQKPDEWASYQAMHAYILDRFVRSEGFGFSRMRPVQDAPRQKLIYADGARFFVGRVQLISPNDGKQPFAYVTNDEVVLKVRLKRAQHKPVDETVSNALDELKAGKEVILARTGDDGRELIGAVRATSACTECHSVPQGTLLGAFLYPLEREPAAVPRQITR